jgi:hypothetical protein
MDFQMTDEMDARINGLGASLFFHPRTVEFAAAQGVDNVFVLYAGRAGVLGDVNAAQAVSALGFFASDVVADVWRGVTELGGPARMGALFGDAMAAAAATLWSSEAAAEMVDMGRVVLQGVEPFGMALYAGWRERGLVGGASDVVHALRELRGDVHIQSVAAAGLHPLEAEMVTRGAAAAQLHGWKPPYPEPDAFAGRVAAAERATSERMFDLYQRVLGAERIVQLAAAVRRLYPDT